jgi:hypothetical protein
MRYLIIDNEGAVDPDALRFMGFSSKRGDSSKIGFFGSGQKYAAAVLLRNRSSLSCVSHFPNGDKLRVEWITKPVIVRGVETKEMFMRTKVRHADGSEDRAKSIPLSTTIDIGPTWDAWMGVREVLSNAVDEGFLHVSSAESGDAWDCPEGGTRFFIKMSPAILAVHNSWDRYFRIDRSSFVESTSHGRILPSIGPGTRFYRKGFLVYESRLNGKYDYDFDDISIGEDRTATRFECNWEAVTLLNYSTPSLKRSILTSSNEFEISLGESCSSLSEGWSEAILDSEIVGTPTEFRIFKGRIDGKVPAPVPSDAWAIKLSGCESVPSLSKLVGKGPKNPHVEVDVIEDREESLLNEAFEILERSGFDLSRDEVKIVQFEDTLVLGDASSSTILISQRVLSMGMREVLATLIEEWAHRRSRACDETRQFQNFLLDRIVELVSVREVAVW